MKLVALSGSRNPEGQTAQAAAAVLKGFAEAGGATELVFLPPLRVERCRQCDDNGWGPCRKEGHCIIDDDFGRLIGEVREADVVVFATPVYYSDLSESLRAFTDRLRRICTHEAGRVGIKGKPAIGICVAGGGGGGAPPCCVSLEKVLATSGLDVVDAIPVRRQNLEAKLARLELVGQWLATRPTSG
ncbi:MAG: flavodoxin family protein [Victivallales bacterium]|jgi:multimeric flavodoxin WrbA|nr:flavodoxin family protein [Victivallales bacterium]MBT7304772.1 flavodoxin family protein [Victivallales bacterium]